MFPIAKMWMEFLCTQIAPTLDVPNINTFLSLLLYAILQEKHVCIGTWIYENMKNALVAKN